MDYAQEALKLHKALRGKIEVTPLCPASVLQNHPDAVLLIDKAAAELL